MRRIILVAQITQGTVGGAEAHRVGVHGRC